MVGWAADLQRVGGLRRPVKVTFTRTWRSEAARQGDVLAARSKLISSPGAWDQVFWPPSVLPAAPARGQQAQDGGGGNMGGAHHRDPQGKEENPTISS